MLYRFHAVLISAGILFSLGFAIYQLVAWRRDGKIGAAALAAVFAVLGAGLTFYLRSFLRSRRDGRTP